MAKETPKFKPDFMEIWAAVFLTLLMLVVNFYTQWAAYSIVSETSFHLTYGVSVSWLGITGAATSVIAMLLSWKGFGLNAIAAFLTSSALATVVANNNAWQGSASTLFALVWMVAIIRYSRKFFEHNPFWTFLSLWWITFISSMSQSIFYKLVFNHAYPLQGVMTLKAVLFGLGGLTILFAFPRKNKEYVI